MARALCCHLEEQRRGRLIHTEPWNPKPSSCPEAYMPVNHALLACETRRVRVELALLRARPRHPCKKCCNTSACCHATLWASVDREKTACLSAELQTKRRTVWAWVLQHWKPSKARLPLEGLLSIMQHKATRVQVASLQLRLGLPLLQRIRRSHVPGCQSILRLFSDRGLNQKRRWTHRPP